MGPRRPGLAATAKSENAVIEKTLRGIKGMTAAVRFSKLVEAAGKPSVHLLWMDPAKDIVLQKAIKANRVLTVHQRPGDTKADYGTVGFEKSVSGQILIFPKSLKQFSDKRVIGVKYDLLEWPEVPKDQEAPKARPPKRPASAQPREAKLPAVTPKRVAAEDNATARVLKFPNPRNESEEESNVDVEDIKDQVRHAMKALEEGKQVAAFNLLKRIIGS
jgi:hypothetical protein